MFQQSPDGKLRLEPVVRDELRVKIPRALSVLEYSALESEEPEDFLP